MLGLKTLKIFHTTLSLETKAILLYFIASRVVLTIIGCVSRIALAPFHEQYHVWNYSKHLWLDIWGVWDTGWYLSLAKFGYSPHVSLAPETLHQANYAFFPLYPLSIYLTNFITRDFFIASLVVSNISLIVACFLLFKLTEAYFNKIVALRAVKYLLVFPTAFIFSGGFSEALFLVLLLAVFLFAQRRQWLFVGIFGFLGALTRFIGIFVIIPLLFEYLEQVDFSFKKIKVDILFLLLIPLGTLAFSYYNFRLTGDFLAFIHIQDAWNRVLQNPMQVLVEGLRNPNINFSFPAWTALLYFLIVNIYYFWNEVFSHTKIKLGWWLLCGYTLIVPLATGISSLPRYILVAFPMYIFLAKSSENQTVDQLLTVTLALLQGFLMVFWSNGFPMLM